MARPTSDGSVALESAEGILADLGVCILRLEMIQDRLDAVTHSLPEPTAAVITPSVEDAGKAIDVVRRAQAEFKRSFMASACISGGGMAVIQQKESSRSSHCYWLRRPRAGRSQESGGSDAHAWV